MKRKDREGDDSSSDTIPPFKRPSTTKMDAELAFANGTGTANIFSKSIPGVSLQDASNAAQNAAVEKRGAARQKMIASGRLPPIMTVFDDTQRGKFLAGFNPQLTEQQQIQYKSILAGLKSTRPRAGSRARAPRRGAAQRTRRRAPYRAPARARAPRRRRAPARRG